MTDNEIIKALELCITCTITDFSACEKCPYNGKCGESDTHIWKDTLALINRQKTEIEAYKHYYNECLNDLKKAHAEIDGLRKENFELKDGYFQKRYEETEHQELMGLREAYRRVDKERDFFQLKAMNLEEEKREVIKDFAAKLKRRECSNAFCAWCAHSDIYGHRAKECDEPYIDKDGKEQKACYVYAKFESYIDAIVKELTESKAI